MTFGGQLTLFSWFWLERKGKPYDFWGGSLKKDTRGTPFLEPKGNHDCKWAPNQHETQENELQMDT